MKNSNATSKWSVVLGVFILIVATLLAGWFLWWFMSDLSKELIVTLVTAVLTIIGALWVNRTTKLKDRELQIQAQQAEKREKVVTNFMSNFWLLVQGDFKSEAAREKHTKKIISDIMINGSLWLSDKTLKEFVEFRLGAQRGEDVSVTGLRIARLMLAFREDLGHKNKGLSEKDMLDVFINDTDKMLEQGSAK